MNIQPEQALQDKRRSLMHQLYDWVSHWLKTPYGIWALFLVAVAESSFFPIPPDVFLMALALNEPKRSFRYATICSIGSVLGGMLGYGLGLWFMESLGQHIIEIYGLIDKYQVVQHLYQHYDVWAVGAAGFTPLPYKLFTITAGAFHLDFKTFVLVSIVSRSARFFLVGGLIYRYGAPIKYFIVKYLNLLTIIFLILLILGFAAIKMLF